MTVLGLTKRLVAALRPFSPPPWGQLTGHVPQCYFRVDATGEIRI